MQDHDMRMFDPPQHLDLSQNLKVDALLLRAGHSYFLDGDLEVVLFSRRFPDDAPLAATQRGAYRVLVHCCFFLRSSWRRVGGARLPAPLRRALLALVHSSPAVDSAAHVPESLVPLKYESNLRRKWATTSNTAAIALLRSSRLLAC